MYWKYIILLWHKLKKVILNKVIYNWERIDNSRENLNLIFWRINEIKVFEKKTGHKLGIKLQQNSFLI